MRYNIFYYYESGLLHLLSKFILDRCATVSFFFGTNDVSLEATRKIIKIINVWLIKN